MQKLDDYSHKLNQWADHEGTAAIALSQKLYDLFKPKSVIDIGCGAGQFLIPFVWRNCKTLGVDGEPTAGELIDNFKQADLRLPQNFGKFDLALCLEVIEHLQPEYEDVLIETLVESSDIIVFSGAKPNQVGTNHYNCREKQYWIDKFYNEGYVYMDETIEILNFMQTRTEFSACPWLVENLFVVAL